MKMSGERLELGVFEEMRDGVPLKFRITTTPRHLTEPVVQHMSTAYLPREPMCSHHKLHEDPVSLGVIQDIWRKMIADGMTVVALREGPGDEADRIVGANMTYLSTKGDKKPEMVVGTKVEPVFDAVVDIAERSKIYEVYGVDKYLSGFGLSVDPKYHGYKIGERLLQARKPLCKAIGIKVTGTVFTHVKSMYLAKKVGFVVMYEEEFNKYTHNGVILFKGIPGKFEQSVWDFS